MFYLYICFFIVFLGFTRADKRQFLEIKSSPKKIKSINSFNTKTIQLNIKPIKLNMKSVYSNSNLENLKQQEAPRVLRSGYTEGTFNPLSLEDDQHLEITVNGKKISFWCGKDCGKLSSIKEKSKIVVLWREIESFVSEISEKVKRRETTHIFLNKKINGCSIHKNLPYLSKGCEGEACGFLQYDKAIKRVNIFLEADVKSKKIGVLNRCQKIKGFEPYTKLIRYGLAEVINPNQQLKELNIKKGDLVTVIKSIGEGYLDACVGKTKIDAIISPADPHEKQAVVKILQNNKSEEWIRLKSPLGPSGFVPGKANFYQGYYGYFPEAFCPEDHPCGKDFLDQLKIVESKLTESFYKYCQLKKDCHSADSILECPLSKDIWKDLSEIFPKNIQCAGFRVSKTACGDSWEGSFTCTCPNLEPRDLNYSYSCKKNERCRMNLPFEL